jgi:hypothetical protein
MIETGSNINGSPKKFKQQNGSVMGNEKSGWRSPENGGTHTKPDEVVVCPNSGSIKAIVFTPVAQNRENIVKEIKRHAQ